jgi:hypothetical protein
VWHRHQTTHVKKIICRSREKTFSLLNISLWRSSSLSRLWLVAATFVRFFCCYFLYQLQKIVWAINQTSVLNYFKHFLVKENWMNKLIFINQLINVFNLFSIFKNLRKFVFLFFKSALFIDCFVIAKKQHVFERLSRIIVDTARQ